MTEAHDGSSGRPKRRWSWRRWLGGCLGCGWSLVVFSAAIFLIVAVVYLVQGVPSGYEETRGLLLEDGPDPDIRFEGRAGETYRFSSDKPDGDEGDSVTVYYDPADPEDTAFTPEGRSDFIRSGFWFAGFVVVVTAVVVLWLTRRRTLPWLKRLRR